MKKHTDSLSPEQARKLEKFKSWIRSDEGFEHVSESIKKTSTGTEKKKIEYRKYEKSIRNKPVMR